MIVFIPQKTPEREYIMKDGKKYVLEAPEATMQATGISMICCVFIILYFAGLIYLADKYGGWCLLAGFVIPLFIMGMGFVIWGDK